MVLGDGGALTWIGLACFMVMLALFVIVNMCAVGVVGPDESGESDRSDDTEPTS